MNKQPTYQSHQGVTVIDANHQRAGQSGHVVDVNERDVQIGTDAEENPVTAVCVGVKFDLDGQVENVPLTSIKAVG